MRAGHPAPLVVFLGRRPQAVAQPALALGVNHGLAVAIGVVGHVHGTLGSPCFRQIV